MICYDSSNTKVTTEVTILITSIPPAAEVGMQPHRNIQKNYIGFMEWEYPLGIVLYDELKAQDVAA